MSVEHRMDTLVTTEFESAGVCLIYGAACVRELGEPTEFAASWFDKHLRQRVGSQERDACCRDPGTARSRS